MSKISTWLLSIIGVVLLGMLINIIIPDSQIAKYIKGVYSFVIIYVIISPIVSCSNIITSFDFMSESFADENYLYSINSNRKDFMEKNIITQCEYRGIRGVNVDIVSHNSENKLILDKIYVYLQNIIIDENFEHIDKYQVLEDVIVSITKIEKENIIYCE